MDTDNMIQVTVTAVDELTTAESVVIFEGVTDDDASDFIRFGVDQRDAGVMMEQMQSDDVVVLIEPTAVIRRVSHDA